MSTIYGSRGRYSPQTPAEQVAAAAAQPSRIACQACKRGWPNMVTVHIDRYGAVAACADPVACRVHAEKIGIYKLTTPMIDAA